MTTITCKIPEKLDAGLEALSRARKVSKSAIVREALEERLRKELGRTATSAFDLVKKLQGTLHGPRDLSTNPRYLDDLGA